MLSYDVLVRGNNLRLENDFLGISSVVLLRSKSGPMLFDTGGYISRLGLLAALRNRGLAPGDIKLVFLSHLHFDHAHNIDLFPNAKFIVSRREWDYARAPHPDDIMTPWGVHAQLEKGNLEFIDGEGTLDEGIHFFPAPGHTPGCYALELATLDKGTVIVAGDAVKYPKEVILKACDLAFDTIEVGTASIKRILDRADRIIPGHFSELYRTADGAFAWNDGAQFNLVVR